MDPTPCLIYPFQTIFPAFENFLTVTMYPRLTLKDLILFCSVETLKKCCEKGLNFSGQGKGTIV